MPFASIILATVFSFIFFLQLNPYLLGIGLAFLFECNSGKVARVNTQPDRSHDFMTLLLQGELIVLPCAHLDPLLEQWMDEQKDTESFINHRLFLLDDSHAHPTISQLLEIQNAPREKQTL